jgi:hypothetical protein
MRIFGHSDHACHELIHIYKVLDKCITVWLMLEWYKPNWTNVTTGLYTELGVN